MDKIVTNYAHQGDLNFRLVDSIPEGAKDITQSLNDLERGGLTLALGEASGHAHTIIREHGTDIRVFEADVDCKIHNQKEKRHFVKIVGNSAKMLHGTFVAPGQLKELEKDRHDIEILPPGIYEQGFELGYDPFLRMKKQVQD